MSINNTYITTYTYTDASAICNIYMIPKVSSLKLYIHKTTYIHTVNLYIG